MDSGLSSTHNGELECPFPLDPTESVQDPPRTRSGRPRREIKLPRRFHDYLPESATSFVEADEPAPVRRVLLIVRDCLHTVLDKFGVWREYPNRPSTDPDSLLSLADLSNRQQPSRSNDTNPTLASFWPFKNATVHSVMRWLNNGNVSKSEAEVTRFVHEVILSPTFRIHELLGFDAHQENQHLDREISQSQHHSQFDERSLTIDIPSGQPGKKAVSFSVPGFLHRSILTVIKEAFTGPLAHCLHLSPFKLFRQDPNTNEAERIYGEVYTSDAFLAEAEKVQLRAPRDPGDPTCTREKVVAALMFSSDATHLANFGNAKAWPIYLMLGNLSKYVRCVPNAGGMYHLAYIPSVSALCRA